MRTRLDPKDRKAEILAAAVRLARERGGYTALTYSGVAGAAGVSRGLVHSYFGVMNELRRAVMGYAIANEVVEIVAQGLTAGDSRAKKASPELKAAAIKYLTA